LSRYAFRWLIAALRCSCSWVDIQNFFTLLKEKKYCFLIRNLSITASWYSYIENTNMIKYKYHKIQTHEDIGSPTPLLSVCWNL
jgi:hypothetical protein